MVELLIINVTYLTPQNRVSDTITQSDTKQQKRCTIGLYMVYSTSFMLFSVTLRNSVTYPILSRMVGYIDDQQLSPSVSPHELDVQVHALIFWNEYVQ